MILSTSPSPVLSLAEDSAQETILAKRIARTIVVIVVSRLPMCNFLVAMPKHPFHGKNLTNIFYLLTEEPSTPAGNLTHSKTFFAISRWRKVCPRASIPL
jgi:hypothetical protein